MLLEDSKIEVQQIQDSTVSPLVFPTLSPNVAVDFSKPFTEEQWSVSQPAS